MAQLEEDEWPADGEPTTTEREAGREADTPPAPTVPVNNTAPDDAVD
jgi:hypothetical protein